MPKMMREKMAAEGLASYIVSYTVVSDDHEDVMGVQYWAENEGHAGEQFDDSFGDDYTITLVESQDEYEQRTGLVLGYGRTENT